MKWFRGLSGAQLRAFEDIAEDGEGAGFSPATLRALEAKGLIVGRVENIYGPTSAPIDRIPMRVTLYHVPLPIHMEWCQWCADHADEATSGPLPEAP